VDPRVVDSKEKGEETAEEKEEEGKRSVSLALRILNSLLTIAIGCSGEVSHTICSIVEDMMVQVDPATVTAFEDGFILNPPPDMVKIVPPALEPESGLMEVMEG